MTKAVKEAKLHSSWINPNDQYETAVTRFVGNVLTQSAAAKFLPAFRPFQRRIARGGFVNSLAQVVLKITSPGIPDFYQGCELWDLNLVDPDNRRPVDFERRREALTDVQRIMALPCLERIEAIDDLLAHWSDGRIKMLVIAGGLAWRRRMPDLFVDGEYEPLDVELTVPGDLVAFTRTLDQRVLIAIVPRLTLRLTDNEHPLPIGERWTTSRILLPSSLASRTFRDVFTGSTITPEGGPAGPWLFAGQALRTLPVAVLIDEVSC
jgi:(1->4)-alpha-D-glucan 1-alpha-D-glucosylmutase